MKEQIEGALQELGGKVQDTIGGVAGDEGGIGRYAKLRGIIRSQLSRPWLASASSSERYGRGAISGVPFSCD